MGKRYDSFISEKTPMLDSIPNFSMNEFLAASGYTRAIAQEMFIILADQGYTEGNIGQYLRRQIL